MRLKGLLPGNSAWRPLCWMLTAVVAGLAGCDSNPLSSMRLYPVKGKVLLADGKPLTSGRIVFVAVKSTLTSPSTIESDGTFKVKGSTGDGLPEGEYRIRIEIDESKLPTVKVAPKRTGSLPFPEKYADEDSSKLTATVKPDETGNNFEFKLTK
ncbi:MAG: hypothetical protein ACHRXM_24360 [Isosphaerales bacterium]